ncbi:hypothetical protein A3A79_02485 [Candidatus Gottesmanbacteria bacterium RIFCSPLOWO2_01_FULL_43_11b]|uniref:HTH cro/C1-type domain-containing protein n=1 Tax=Candidatus Gottesmanbacteria bacterium RIFCSPLOWO2_01_FULL_43_11b TaxID=1798392 RepID=A0A1F6AH07_9BACT|nr:MAG: hypothetical protein A3A79_02485 [Candidatus Gottesmanbacteria bacterium RIFCSPLOWO2_01_FULL_43_11b]
MLKAIGVNVKRLRKAQKRKSLDVAVEAGIEPSYFSKIENGMARPTLEKIYAICRSLHIKSSQILPF